MIHYSRGFFSDHDVIDSVFVQDVDYYLEKRAQSEAELKRFCSVNYSIIHYGILFLCVIVLYSSCGYLFSIFCL